MSFWELFLIVLVAFVVIKPERLPEIAFYLGKLFRKIKTWHQAILDKYHHWQ